MKTRSAWLAGVPGLLVVAGCGLVGNGNGDDVSPGRLELITGSDVMVTFAQRVPVQVRYLDPDDAPLPDAFVSFEVSQDTAGTTLSDRNALTGPDGVAETTITGGDQVVDFEVRISVPADDQVDPIQVRVKVEPADDADYIVRVRYDGPVTLGQVDVYLYDVERACDTLTPGWEPGAPSPDAAWSQLTIVPDAQGELPDRELSVQDEVQLTYAVARAGASDGQGGSSTYLVTFGCEDPIPPPEAGSPVVLEIAMHDLWPDMEGTYQIDSELNLLDLLPDAAGDILGPVGEMFTDPGVGILRIIALAAGGDDYYDESPWNTLFSLCVGIGDPLAACQDAGEVVLNVRGMAVAGTLGGLVDRAIAAVPGSAGDTLDEVLQAGADIFENAESFSMGGDLVITGDPDEAGLLGGDNRITYNRITWRWSGNDRTIDMRREAFVHGAEISAAVVFHPTDPEVYSLELSPFVQNLVYGELLVWILEGVVFPEVIGPEVMSFEDFFGTLIDCAELGDAIAVEYGDAVGTALEAGCEVLQLSALDALHAWIAGSAPELLTWYQVSTPAEDPCRMSLPGDRESFSIEALGGEVPCRWTGELRSEAAEPEPLDGVWWGERL